MKSFRSFLTEATSTASQQAAKMGLTGDGHGGWYDNRGEFVAKTEGGKLVFFNANQQPGEKDPPQSEKDKKLSGRTPADPNPGLQAQETDPRTQGGGSPQPEDAAQLAGAAQQVAQNDPSVSGQQAAAAAAQTVAEPQSAENGQTGPADVPKTKGTLTIAFGRFNPPTTGHEKLLNKVAASADDGDYIIVPSRSEDKKKNPLGIDRKAALMRQMYPDHAERIVNDAGNKTIFDVLRKAHNDGYANVRVVGGGDRVKEYEKLVNKYNGSTYQFDNIEVVNAGNRDADADGDEGMSASKMRKAAKDNDFRAFLKGMPKSMDNETAAAVFAELQDAMGVTPVEPAMAEEWEVAPRLDPQGLRESYIRDMVFNIGDYIVHDSTGMVAEIVRKGANHLICVTEDQKMFKAWTQDISHYEENFVQQTSNGRTFRQFLNGLSL